MSDRVEAIGFDVALELQVNEIGISPMDEQVSNTSLIEPERISTISLFFGMIDARGGTM